MDVALIRIDYTQDALGFRGFRPGFLAAGFLPRAFAGLVAIFTSATSFFSVAVICLSSAVRFAYIFSREARICFVVIVAPMVSIGIFLFAANLRTLSSNSSVFLWRLVTQRQRVPLFPSSPLLALEQIPGKTTLGNGILTFWAIGVENTKGV
jgi:hypothetical protein